VLPEDKDPLRVLVASLRDRHSLCGEGI
jgi:hypothetical protein